MIVQIYEITSAEEAAAIAAMGIEHLGVLVGPGEYPREQSIAATRAIFAAVPAGAKRLALSLSHDLEQVVRVVEATRPDIVHIGAMPEHFPVERCRALKARCPGVALMRAIPVVGAESVETARSYEGVADFLLLDSYDAKTGLLGALGRVHDWAISRRIVETVAIPVILAGGLGPDNVAAAIAAVKPAGVDSKTKTDRPGQHVKDLEKVRHFAEAARGGFVSGIDDRHHLSN